MIKQFQNINNYVFDLYGTLVDIHTDEEKISVWEQMADYCRMRGAIYQPEELKRLFQSGINTLTKQAEILYPQILYPEISLSDVFQTLYNKKGILPDPEAVVDTAVYFRKITTEYIRLYPGAVKLLKELRRQGKVWLLSNAQKTFTRWELDQLGLTPLFDGIYLSSEYGSRKPDLFFYRKLLEDEKIIPEEAVMIGNDGTCDILGGRRAGMKTIYIHSNLSPKEELPQADYVLEEMDLKKLCRILT